MEKYLEMGNELFADIFNANNTVMVIVGLLVFYFIFRSRIKTFFAFVFGQKAFLDDGAIARYNNKDFIYENNKILLTKNINIKSFLTLYLIFMTSLISPFISVTLFAGFMYVDSKIKLANFTDFKFFDDDVFDDKFGNWLNKPIFIKCVI